MDALIRPTSDAFLHKLLCAAFAAVAASPAPNGVNQAATYAAAIHLCSKGVLQAYAPSALLFVPPTSVPEAVRGVLDEEDDAIIRCFTSDSTKEDTVCSFSISFTVPHSLQRS